MKKLGVAIILLLTISIFSGCKGMADNILKARSSERQEATEQVVNISEKEEDIEWVSYVNDFITLQYPKNWILNSTNGEDYKGISFLEQKDGEPILSISTGEAWHSDLTKSKEDYEKELNEIYENVKVEELIKVSIHLQEGTKLVYTYDRDGVNTEVIRFDVVVGAASHQFFFVFPSTDRERLVNIISHMIESVEFIKNN